MDSGIRILLTIILPFIVLLGFLYAGGYYMKDFTMTSEYQYEVRIEPDADISDVNVTVPFPSDLADGSFSRPKGWNTEIYEDENNLSISANNISADFNSTLSLTMKTDDEIRTWDPLEKEPLLDPEAKFTEVESDPSNDSEAEKCYTYNYTSTIEISYESAEDTQVKISVKLTGMNEWWLLENLENQYSDKLSLDVEGRDKDYAKYDAEGQLKTGIGYW